MNIVYTINGEGMGHASRSSVVIDYLLQEGHHVAVISAGKRPLTYLRQKFGTVAEVTGLHMVYRENKVRRIQTVMKVLSNATDIKGDFATIKQALSSFKPQVVITDFDFHGYIAARQFRVPLISIDNIQLLRYAQYSVDPEDFIDYELNVMIARMMVPKADYFLITTFVEPELRDKKLEDKVFFLPPPLRKKILDHRATQGQHILVYQTSDSYSQLVPVLAQSHEQYVIYNSNTKTRAANVTYKDFNEDSFIADLASAKGVITNGGFNVITESLYYKKPILSIPISNFYEQKLNGNLLQKKGLGLMVKRLSKVSLNEFIYRLDSFKKTAHAVRFDNSVLFDKLDSILKSIA